MITITQNALKCVRNAEDRVNMLDIAEKLHDHPIGVTAEWEPTYTDGTIQFEVGPDDVTVTYRRKG